MHSRMVSVEDERENIHQFSTTLIRILNICSKNVKSPAFPDCSCRATKWALVASAMSWGRGKRDAAWAEDKALWCCAWKNPSQGRQHNIAVKSLRQEQLGRRAMMGKK